LFYWLWELWIPTSRITCMTKPLYQDIVNLPKAFVCHRRFRKFDGPWLISKAISLVCKSFIYRTSIVFTNADYQINPNCLNPTESLSLTRHGASEDSNCSIYWGHTLTYLSRCSCHLRCQVADFRASCREVNGLQDSLV